jgi:hypothetical protein
VKTLRHPYWISLFLACTHNPLLATDYAACYNAKAYRDPMHHIHDPSKDWICQLAPAPNNPRCIEAQKMLCSHTTGPGPHDVPAGGWAWFMAFVEGIEAPLRCTCGCLQKDTHLATVEGNIPIAQLLDYARYQNVEMLIAEGLGEQWQKSQPLRAYHFTVGPEKKPVYEFTFEDRPALTVTSDHPMRVWRSHAWVMVPAHDVSPNDIFLGTKGESVPITGINQRLLPATEPVINVTNPTQDSTKHVLLANGIQVGDHYWQQELKAKQLRLERRGLQQVGG